MEFSSWKAQQFCEKLEILDGWEKTDDGYYYYKKSMKEGDCLENKLVSGIKLKLNKEEMIDFSDKQMKVVIKVESRQSKYNDYSNAWN